MGSSNSLEGKEVEERFHNPTNFKWTESGAMSLSTLPDKKKLQSVSMKISRKACCAFYSKLITGLPGGLTTSCHVLNKVHVACTLWAETPSQWVASSAVTCRALQGAARRAPMPRGLAHFQNLRGPKYGCFRNPFNSERPYHRLGFQLWWGWQDALQ